MESTILTDPAARFAARHSASLIVDMQRDFCVEGYGAHRTGRDMAPARVTIALLAAARAAGVRVAHVGFPTLPNHGGDGGAWLAQRWCSTICPCG